MAKTRFTEDKRNIIYQWMMDQYDKKQEGNVVDKLLEKAINAANKALVKRYPAKDMEVLKKYELTRKDICLTFIEEDSQRVFGCNFESEVREKFADIPHRGGCNNGVVFPISAAGAKTIEDYDNARQDANKARQQKKQDYRSFLAACKYVDDAHEVVPLPIEMHVRLFSGAAIIPINQELVNSLKNEFKEIV